ncbi:MAG: helicase-related protein [Candidatus Omnitrophota bacterium]
MEILDLIFSPALQQSMKDHTSDTDVNNIERDFSELVAAGLFYFQRRHLLWIVGENENLNEKKEKLELWLHALGIGQDHIRIHFYAIPFEDPYINNDSSVRAIGYKARLAAAILEDQPLIVITTLSALGLKIENRVDLPLFFLELKKDETMNRQYLIDELNAMGYQTRNIVEEPGDIAWRGSIVDVFPIDSDFPVRLEIEGDQVVSLRVFDPDSQKSLKHIPHIVFPICRFFFDYDTCADYFKGSQKGLEYLPQLLGNHCTLVSDKKKVIDEYRKLLDNYEKIYDIHLEEDPQIKPPSDWFRFQLDEEPIFNINETWDTISSDVEWVKVKKGLLEFDLQDIGYINEKLDKGQFQLYVFSPKQIKIPDSFKQVVHIESRIPYSFENHHTRTIFLAERNFQYIEKIERRSQVKSENLANEIQIGDVVVHKRHGIGKFIGFTRLTFEGNVTEFLKIEYLDSEYLYVPVYELDVLAKYAAFEGQAGKLDKLGGHTWEQKTKKAQKSIISFARELLELYATRKTVKGNAFPRDYELEEKLEAGFQYVETEDQKRAIKEVLADLEKEYPMDRLLCGDVSFGKTEVALRAALRVVANGKQVVVLCPTTILAYQHFTTFSRRLAGFPVTVAMLSRMVQPKRRKTVIKALAEGKIDIIIGTHSLISKHVTFKRLGLYIIDEEQRFGVFQKERIKTDREEIDVLSMSATPIPRTLSFSLAGLQDISIIQTPPIGRVAIKNYVGYFSRDIIVSAVLSEVERGGSVFIVYNDIGRIYEFKEDLQKWLPNIPSVVIHAQMKGEDIEANLMDFIDKKFRVLISTTIIENGIDIPDVNTLIILDADRFGLTQLYQLRGRIGRGNRQAYAYFLVRSMDLSEKAKARLEAIREFAELGAGYKLAEFDLKLRGAGSLLGNKQHGHIEALGFDYYHQLLANTIKELRGEIETKKESRIHIHFSYSIDAAYIKNSSERIMLYRRILEAEGLDSLEELRIELEDRYGRLPQSIDKIFFAGTIRLLMEAWQLEEVDVYLERVIMKFRDSAMPESLFESSKHVWHYPGNVKMEIIDPLTREFSFPDYKKFVHFVEAKANHLI